MFILHSARRRGPWNVWLSCRPHGAACFVRNGVKIFEFRFSNSIAQSFLTMLRGREKAAPDVEKRTSKIQILSLPASEIHFAAGFDG